MKFDPTLPGNPNKLTINQHIFPRSAIDRFVADDGLVQVERLGKLFRADPKNSVFCAQRAWDQTTETRRSHPIEAEYARLADQIVSGQITALTPAMDGTVTEFFLLWNHRFNAAWTSAEDLTLNIEAPEKILTKEQEEVAEMKGAMFFRGNKLPYRFINGLSIMRETDRVMRQMADAHWGIVRAAEGEFLVPDSTAGLSVVPVSPTICLVHDSDDVAFTLKGVGLVNQHLKKAARHFVFARDLTQCPVWRGSNPTCL